MVVVLGLCAFILLYFKNKSDIAKKKRLPDMLGFCWGDRIETVNAWAKMRGLKYYPAGNTQKSFVFVGEYPGLEQTASYRFHIVKRRLDSLEILVQDPEGSAYRTVYDKLALQYAEPWDEDTGEGEEEENATWVRVESLIILMHGESGFTHLRYFNRAKMSGEEHLEEEQEALLEEMEEDDERLSDAPPL